MKKTSALFKYQIDKNIVFCEQPTFKIWATIKLLDMVFAHVLISLNLNVIYKNTGLIYWMSMSTVWF